MGNHNLFKRIISGALALSVSLTMTNGSYQEFFSTIQAEEDLSSRIIRVEEGESSEYGYVPMWHVDDDGNIFEPNLTSSLLMSSQLPERYSLADDGFLTSVKNQGYTGTCWAHSVVNAAESNLIKNGYATNDIDLSESHLVYFGNCAYSNDVFDFMYHEGNNYGRYKGYLNGGNCFTAQSVLARGSGFVSQPENEDVLLGPELDESVRYESEWLLSDSCIYSKDDIISIKNNILINGALAAGIYVVNNDINTQYAQYENEDKDPNHSISIVGWDDNFSKENFDIQPDKDGAWICKNSWSSEWGDNGYFYLSYYDKSLSNIYSVEVIDAEKYDKIYQYDGSKNKAVSALENMGITGANIFFADTRSSLEAVSFHTSEADVPYTVSIYKNNYQGNPMSGECLYVQSGMVKYAGYHMIELSEKIELNKGDNFSVVVYYDKNGTEIYGDSYADSGYSFFANGKANINSEWAPMHLIEGGFDLGIKAFVDENVKVDAIDFPDASFREYVSQNFDTDKDGILSDEERNAVTSIDLKDYTYKGYIFDITGVEYFPELTNLDCSDTSVCFMNLKDNRKLKKENIILKNVYTLIGNQYCGFDLRYNFSNFNPLQVGNVYNAVLESNIFWVNGDDESFIMYEYLCKDGVKKNFSLIPDKIIHGDKFYQGGSCEYCGKANPDFTTEVTTMTEPITTPEETTVTEVSTTPEETTVTEVSTTPEETTVTEVSTTPEETTVTEVSTTPEETTVTEASTTHEETTVTEASTTPEETTVTEASTTPEETTVTEVSTTPEETTVTEVSTTPEETTVTEVSTTPEPPTVIDNINDHVKFEQSSISLSGNIAMHIYVRISDIVADDPNAYMLITLPNGSTEKVYIKDAKKEDEWYVFTAEVAVKEMCDEVGFKLFAKGTSTEEYRYSVKTYAEYIIKNEKTYGNEIVQLVSAMLDYGARSQLWFDYNTDNLANDKIPPVEYGFDITAESLSKYKLENTSNEFVGKFTSLYLSLESETELNIKFTPATDNEDIKFSVNGKDITAVKKNGIYTISVKDISATALDSMIEVEAVDSQGNKSILKCYALSYAYIVLSGNYDQKLKDLVISMRNFNLLMDRYQSVC